MKINQHNPSYEQANERKNHLIISVGAEIVFDKIQYPLVIKILRIGIQGNSLHLIKSTYKKKTNPTTNIMYSGERLNASPAKFKN